MKKIKMFACAIFILALAINNDANAMCGFGWISITPPTPSCSCPSNRTAIKHILNNICQEEKCVSAGAATHYLNNGWMNGCCAVARMDEDESTDKISVYPNPVNNVLRITGAFEASAEIKIRDAIGKVVYNNSISSPLNIDVSGWERGMYFVTVKNSNNVMAEKILVE